jgi:hypothetical protein
MIDPRREVVLTKKPGDEFKDRTPDVTTYEVADGRIMITYASSQRAYAYGSDNAMVLRNGLRAPLSDTTRVEVDGVVWDSATEVWTFTGPGDAWTRVFYIAQGKEKFVTLPASRVRLLSGAAEQGRTADILRYWRSIISRFPVDDSLRRSYEKLGFIHPESILASYLAGSPIQSREPRAQTIFPFRRNLSQQKAVELGLLRDISVIEGPPGTGKTETILNLIANIMATEGQTVGVVSFSNAAVDNVRNKLDELHFGHVIANLGKEGKRADFFRSQESRNAQVTNFMANSSDAPPPEQRLSELDRLLTRLQQAERRHAELRNQLAAYQLELQHFERHLETHETPDLQSLPLLRRSSERILTYLAETEVEQAGAKPGIFGRIRHYLRYGSTRGLDPADTQVVLGLQRAFYAKRIEELRRETGRLESDLLSSDFERLTQEHQHLSTLAVRTALRARYSSIPRTTYAEKNYRLGTTFKRFVEDFPVIMSTCHSLRASLPSGYLLDYLIIDEASQVDLLSAGLALSCCRNLVVVGDLQQLPHIAHESALDIGPPVAAYDYQRHSILSSLKALYGEELPSTLLREHYRCDPAIIGFCNKSFYGGKLIPFSTSKGERPMVVVRTVEGNHERLYQGGGRSNRREVDVIVAEVIKDHCQGVPTAEIGITTPYRRQVDTFGEVLIDPIETDTVHKFQGRQKEVVILSTVLDETWRGQLGLKFVDDPQLVNVAVSRAAKKFILVTNHDMLPKSRRIKDLIAYILYQGPDHEAVDSEVVSVFDLLYREYSQVLQPLAARLDTGMTYKSEAIILTLLEDLLAEDQYAHLTLVRQVLLRNLLPSMAGLTQQQQDFVRHRSSVDFVVYNRVSNSPLLVIEVDGFAFHENNPVQLARDELKDDILRLRQIPLLRLRTTGSGEEARIRRRLDEAEAQWARRQSESLARSQAQA